MAVSDKEYSEALAINEQAKTSKVDPKALKKAIQAIDKYERAQAYELMTDDQKKEYDKMMGIKLVISGAISTVRFALRPFMSKESIDKVLPENIVDMSFALVFKPELIVQMMNKKFEEIAVSYGIPCDHLIVTVGKPIDGDLDCIVQVYDGKSKWVSIPVNIADSLRHKKVPDEFFLRLEEIKADNKKLALNP